MNHIVCITKSYRDDDFKLWYDYHKKMNFIIHVLDNESSVDIKQFIGPEDTYEKIIGFPDQWNLYNDIINNNRYNFNENDFIAFIDDDEFLWHFGFSNYHKLSCKKKYKKYIQMDDYFRLVMEENNVNCILIPQILMSSKKLKKKRSVNLIDSSKYRRDDTSSQGKCVVVYKKDLNYDFSKENVERGHVPFINNKRKSVVDLDGISTTTYGKLNHKALFRLYHYHIKSVEDWNIKINRGSCANKIQIYNSDILKNEYVNYYIYKDNTMKNIITEFNL